MNLYNASSLFTGDIEEILRIAKDPEQLRSRLIEIKKALLDAYHFTAWNLPEDFTTAPYVIATNHLTDSDAPLIISYHDQVMRPVLEVEPELFVFAKENCFNGVSIPKELVPVLEKEKVIAVDRTSLNGSMKAMRAAKNWFAEGGQPKHFLIFPQGTIYDINKDRAEDIEQGAFWLGRMLGIPVLPAFIEQAVEGAENRIVFGQPIHVPPDCRNFDGHKQLWLERVIDAQNQLERLTGAPARPAALDKEHQTRKRFKSTLGS